VKVTGNSNNEGQKCNAAMKSTWWRKMEGQAKERGGKQSTQNQNAHK
jgi:hypothetical protein